MTFVTLTPQQFQTFSESVSTKSFMQSLEMAELFQKRGYKTEFVGLEIDGNLKVAALLFVLTMTGGLHMEINSGPISVDSKYQSDFYKALQTYAKENGALELLVKPYDTYQTFDSNGKPLDEEQSELITNLTSIGFKHDGLLTGYPDGEPTWHYIKDLRNLTQETLLKSYNKNSQRNLKKAQKNAIRIRSISYDEIANFKSIIEETGSRQGFSDKSLEYYQALYTAFGESRDFLLAELNVEEQLQKIILALQNETDSIQVEKLTTQKEELESLLASNQKMIPLAALLLIFYGNEATYLFGGSASAYQKYGAAFLVQHEAITKAINRGIDYYNFLGITGNFDGSDGVLRFKQNFNGYIVRKMGTFRYYPKPIKYKFIQFIKKVLRR